MRTSLWRGNDLKTLLLAISLLASGCAAQKKPVTAPVAAKVIVHRACLESVELSDRTECYGEDLEHLHCTGFVIKEIKGCEVLQVKEKKL